MPAMRWSVKDMHKDFYFTSSGAGTIRACRWEPAGKVRAVFQIVHGIAEHVERYDEFADFLTENGILVVAEDHMGHGKSVSNFEELGYFTGGWFSAVEDTYNLLRQIHGEYEDVPYILFGHSMGSFMVRTLLQKYPDSGIDACVICGTGWQPAGILAMGVNLCILICKLTDARKPNALLQILVFGSYNKRIKKPRTAYDWLNRLDSEVDAYIADPLCGFPPPSALLRDMLIGISFIQNKNNLRCMNKEIPVLFIAGGDDPVGSYGKGVQKTADEFAEIGMTDVSVKIYPACRHEILNEINKHDIYLDVLDWINSKSGG